MIKVGNANVSDQNGKEDDTTHIETRQQTSSTTRQKYYSQCSVSVYIVYNYSFTNRHDITAPVVWA